MFTNDLNHGLPGFDG